MRVYDSNFVKYIRRKGFSSLAVVPSPFCTVLSSQAFTASGSTSESGILA